MWNLDDFRIGNLAKFRIVQLHDPLNPLTHLHDLAKEDIDKALAAYQAQDYEAFDAYSRQAWANEARVYPQAQQTANDVVQGVIFYLFLLIPFAYFLERLLFGFSDLKRQLIAAFGIFLVIFFVFSQIHPAFSIGAVNPLIILIAFVMLALSVIVFGSWSGASLKNSSSSSTSPCRASIRPMSARPALAFAAFALGISNMRRRKERDTADVSDTGSPDIYGAVASRLLSTRSATTMSPHRELPSNNGILLRLPTWDSLQQPAYRLLSDEYSSQFPVAPRAWFFGTTQGQQSFLHLTRAHFATDVKGRQRPHPAGVAGDRH